ncbi:MAG: HEAT repeat domain-containing protein [Gaiella sp.]
MDLHGALLLACLGAGAVFVLAAAIILGGRARHDRRRSSEHRPPVTLATIAAAAGDEGRTGDWQRGTALLRLVEERHELSGRLLRQAIRSDDPALRHTAVTALGIVAQREDWAVDLLLEALAEERASPVRVVAQLDRVADRAAPQLVRLLTHPAPVVRAAAARLLVRCPGQAEPELLKLVSDANPSVRAASLDTLLHVGGAGALRAALALLDDPAPAVRGRAARAAAALGGIDVAPWLMPLLGDGSWWVRESALEVLIALGPGVGEIASAALAGENLEVRASAMRLLHESGALAEMSPSVYADLLARVAELRTRPPAPAVADDIEVASR